MSRSMIFEAIKSEDDNVAQSELLDALSRRSIESIREQGTKMRPTGSGSDDCLSPALSVSVSRLRPRYIHGNIPCFGQMIVHTSLALLARPIEHIRMGQPLILIRRRMHCLDAERVMAIATTSVRINRPGKSTQSVTETCFCPHPEGEDSGSMWQSTCHAPGRGCWEGHLRGGGVDDVAGSARDVRRRTGKIHPAPDRAGGSRGGQPRRAGLDPPLGLPRVAGLGRHGPGSRRRAGGAAVSTGSVRVVGGVLGGGSRCGRGAFVLRFDPGVAVPLASCGIPAR